MKLTYQHRLTRTRILIFDCEVALGEGNN